MKKTKKIISLLLTIQMLFACTLVPSAIATDSVAEEPIDAVVALVIDEGESPGELSPMMARGCGYKSVNQMQHLINSGQAPSSVTYVHNGFQGQQPHVHFSDGTAMNFDGTAHHGNPNPSVSTMRWLNSQGWCIS